MLHRRPYRNRWVRTTALSAGLLGLAVLGVVSGCADATKSGSEIKQEVRDQHNRHFAELMAQTASQDFRVGNLDQALANIDAAISYEPEYAPHYVLRGRILIEQHRLDLAAHSLKAALELNPEACEAHYYIALVYQRWSDLETACAHYLDAARIDPSSEDYMMAAIETLISLKRLDEAEELLSSALTHFEHSAGMHRAMGYVFFMRGEASTASDYFRQAMMLAPDDMTVVEDYATALFQAGDPNEAQYQLARLLSDADYTDRHDIRRLYAMCLLQTDHPVEARLEYIKLTRLAPTNCDAWVELGVLNHQLGDDSGLRQVSQRLIGSWPTRFEGYMLRGLLNDRLGNFEQASKDFRHAADLSGDLVEPWLLLGRALEQCGEQTESEQAFATARRLAAANAAQAEDARLTFVPEDDSTH
ncbi:MAG: hypothetical protein D8M59_11070 [Planctomycetes bacterium]|nr:hypothetical protein [Planctomycetota bacterium]NOG54107.1 tetratricopeptide repeat protein [Planctomycetota bacterium]